MEVGQAHWSIESLDWEIEQSPECASFISPNGSGALQISCFRKQQGIVAERDIAWFREEALRDSGVEPKRGTFGEFDGLMVSHEVDGRFLRRWWLWHDATNLFVTYNCESSEMSREILLAERLMASLRACAAQQRVAPDKGRGGAADASR